MSTEKKPCPNCAWAIKEAQARKLPMTARWVLTNVAEFVNKDTLEWAGSTCITMLADYTGLSREGVRQALGKIPRDLLMVARHGKQYQFKLLRTANVVDSKPRSTANVVDSKPRSTANVVDSKPSQKPSTANHVDSPLPTTLAESPLVPLKKEKERKKESPPKPPQGGASDDTAIVVAAWNDMARGEGLPAVRLPVAADRRAKLGGRLKEHGLKGLLRAVEAVAESPFCLGQKNGFRADFDFLVQTKSCRRLINGFYADRKPAAQRQDASSFGEYAL